MRSADARSRARRSAAPVSACIGIVTAACLVSAGWEMSQTYDEPAHLAAGMEWLQTGAYELSQENPPIARIAAAIGPTLAGLKLPPAGVGRERGTAVLYSGSRYRRNLALARMGALPFLAIAVFAVWGWTLHIANPRAALLAVAALCTLAPFLAHAGLATTDAPFAAAVALALYTVALCVERPTAKRSVLLGVALGLAVATKFSALVFLPPAAVAVALASRLSPGHADAGREISGGMRRPAALALALAVGCGVTWSAYRFSVGRPADEPQAARWIAACAPDAQGIPGRALRALADARVPAPELVNGVVAVCAHDARGHPSYLLGRRRRAGVWFFHPLALGVKTPIPFLILAIAGFATAWRAGRRRNDWRLLAPGIAALAILGVAMRSNLNIGSRHVLAVYPLLAIAAGLGAERLWRMPGRRRAGRAAVVALLAVQVSGLARSYPDFIGYFNSLAGDEPGEWLVDSDLDWGQGVHLLESYFRGRDAEVLHIAYWGTARLCEHELPRLVWLQSGEPVNGWIAISETYRQGRATTMRFDPCTRYGHRVGNSRAGYAWLADHEPVARLGGSIRVYHIEGG